MFITITAGHSHTDPGAINGTIKEADIAQDMRNMVAYYLNTTVETLVLSLWTLASATTCLSYGYWSKWVMYFGRRN